MSARITLAIALLLPPLGSGAASQDPTVPDALPEFRPVGGEVRVWRPGGREIEKATVPTRVHPQDRIGSVGGSVARLWIQGDILATLKGVEPSRDEGLALERAADRVVLKLYRGSIVVESVDAPVSVETPHGKVEGTAVYFIVEAKPDSTRVVVIDGRVSLSNTIAGLELDAGEAGLVTPKKEPSKGKPPDLRRELAWSSEIETRLNLVRNPGFEDDLADWGSAEFGGKRLARVDQETARSGRKSARVDLPNVRIGPDTKTVHACLRQPAGDVLKPGQKCYFRAWVRTGNYRVDGKEEPIRASIYFDQGWKKSADVKCPPAEGAWRCVRLFTESQGSSFQINLVEGWDKPYSGTVWVDDVFFGVVPVVPPKGQEKRDR